MKNKTELEQTTKDLEKETRELSNRRDFLRSLGKWSAAVIGAVTLATNMPGSEAAAWVNRRGSWVNGGGGAWANRGVG